MTASASLAAAIIANIDAPASNAPFAKKERFMRPSPPVV
jgi:hypothetical protein